MEIIEESIEVNVSAGVAYYQWTQFEEFPLFMEGVTEVRRLDDRRLHWRADIAGRLKEWDAEIFEQIPGRRIAWRSMSGAKNSGIVSFTVLSQHRTRISLRLSYSSEGIAESAQRMLGVIMVRVVNDLRHFKEFIERRNAPTIAWRQRIPKSIHVG